MAFLDKFSDRGGYTDANIYQFERRPKTPRPNLFQYGDWGPSSGRVRSGGLIDKVGSRNAPPTSGNPTEGLLGIQNTTGFAQEAPNVVYDQQPEQFAKELALRKRGLDIEEMRARGVLENNAILNDTRQQNADANMMRAKVAQYQAQNPNMLVRETPEGYIAINAKTGDVVDLGAMGMGMATPDRLAYQRDTAYGLQDKRNEGAMGIAQLTQGGLNTRQGAEHEFQRGNTIFKEGNNNWRTNVREQDPTGNAIRLYNSNPELRKFIHLSEDGKSFVLDVPGQMTKGGLFSQPGPDPNAPTPEQHKMLLQLIYGGNAGPQPAYPQTGPATPPVNTAKPEPPLAPSGLGLGSGTVLNPANDPSGFFNAFRNSGGGGGFNAAPKQYDAAPGQYTSPAGQAAQTTGERVIKMVAPDGRELDVPESKVQELISLGAKVAGNGGTTGQAAGAVSGVRAGQMTPGTLGAGQLGGRSAGSVR